jgi:hypothetical protein
MPADDRLRFDDHQGVQNARRNPIEAGKNEAIEVAEGESLRGFSSEHVELVAQRQDLGLASMPIQTSYGRWQARPSPRRQVARLSASKRFLRAAKGAFSRKP